MHKTNIFECDYCTEIYSTHDEKVHDEKNYKHQCSHCNKWKKQKSELNHHMKNSCLKNPDRVIECVYCSRSITDIPQSLKHLNEDHKKKGDHLCF